MAIPVRVVIFALLAIAAMIAVSACDSGGGPAVPTTVPARPTATTEAVQPHRLRLRDTPTTAVADNNQQPTATVSAEVHTPVPTTDFGIQYTNYVGKTGNWSIDYPNDWQVSEQGVNVQFIEPAQEAFIQVTTSPMDPSNTNEDLVQIASNQLAQAFGDTYSEQDQEKQNDGSYRIDFTFTADNVNWVGQTFVEGRQSNLYMLFLATSKAEEESDKYDSIFTHVIDSYILPSR